MNMFSKVFGTRSQREVKRIMPLVEKIESLRPEMQKLSDELNQLLEKVYVYANQRLHENTDNSTY